MARSFTNDGSANDYASLTPQGFTAWGYGTIAGVVYCTSSAASVTWLCVGTEAQDLVEAYMQSSSRLVGFWNGSAGASRTSATGMTLNEWMLVGYTKATGTTTVRFHLLRFTTGTWTHENTGGGTIGDPTGTGATEHIVGGFNVSSGANSWPGHIAAVGAWQAKAMTDSEFERLARGQWQLWNPDLYVEYPSGRDFPNRTTVDASRNRMRQKAVGSQVGRTNIAGPPGFRFSALTRRR